MNSADQALVAVQVEDVYKSFGKVAVLSGMTMTVNKGEAVCLIGPSGSGKSTLLRCINGLIDVDAGRIQVGPHPVHQLRAEKDKLALRRDVSIVFQQYNLFPHRTALENIMMAPIKVLRQDSKEVEERARALLLSLIHI